jgi:hypothetical protein
MHCHSYKKYWANSADLLIDMLKEEAVLNVWQTESKVLKTRHTVRQRMLVGTGSGEDSGMCDREQTEIRICF